MVTPATSVQLEALACLRGRHDTCPHGLDDRARLLDQLRVAGVHPARQIEVVLEPDAHVAPEQYRLCDPWHLHTAYRKRSPHALGGQVVHHGEQVPHVRRDPVGDAGAQLDHGRGGHETFLDHLLDERQVAGVEHLQLHFNPQIAQYPGTLAAVIRGGNVGAVAVAEVERAAIQRGDLGAIQPLAAQFDHVAHALLLADEVAAGRGSVGQPLRADADVAAHAAGQIDDDVDLALADALDYLAVVTCRHAESAG